MINRRSRNLKLFNIFSYLNWKLILIIIAISFIGIMTLYSAGTYECQENPYCINFGSWTPWAVKQLIRFAIGFIVMFIITFINPRFWVKSAYPLYLISLISLIIVEYFGTTGLGATRWISIFGLKFQPSETIKITLVLALAKYFSSYTINEIKHVIYLIVPSIMVLLPVGLVLKQPDLGTAMILIMIGGLMFFSSGVSYRKFIIVITITLIALPIVWQHGLYDYQKARILTFLDPEADMMGAGYHITQSKIALGSGGFWGKGFLQGSQTHLNFLPEKQTDFIFTIIAEEFGMFGCLVLLTLYFLLLYQCYKTTFATRSQFSKLVCIGIASNFFLYMFINIAMVMGLLPVVGVPLPLISYGGTSMITLLIGFGLIQNAYLNMDTLISGKGS